MIVSPKDTNRLLQALIPVSQAIYANNGPLNGKSESGKPRKVSSRKANPREQSARYLKYSPQAFQTLRWLSTAARPTPSGLAAHLGAAPATITSLLDRLEQSDLIARAPSIRDRRRIALSLTARGRRAIAAINAEDRANCTPLLAAIAPEHRETFLRNLEHMADSLNGPNVTAASVSSASKTSAAVPPQKSPKRGLLSRKPKPPKSNSHPQTGMTTDRRKPSRKPR